MSLLILLRSSPAPAFDPASLFTGVRDGWCFNTAAMNPVFEDAAGTTAAADAGDVVGRFFDYSPNGRHLKNNNTPTKGILRIDANGIKSVEVNNAGTSMLQSDSVFPAKTDPYTWYLVCSYSGVDSGQGGLQGTLPNTLDLIYNYPGLAHTCLREGGDPVANHWAYDLANNSPFIVKVQHTAAATNNGILKVVGGSTYTVNLANGAAIGNAANSYIKHGSSSGGNATLRTCFDMLVTDVLTAEEETAIEAYLVEKFGAWGG